VYIKDTSSKGVVADHKTVGCYKKKGCAQVSFLQTEKSEIQRPRETGRIVIAPSHTNLAPKNCPVCNQYYGAKHR
jgi:hypothetical protein